MIDIEKLGEQLCDYIVNNIDPKDRCESDSPCDICPFTNICKRGAIGSTTWLKEALKGE